MKCNKCNFDLPNDWPGCYFEFNKELTLLCEPCKHEVEDIGINRIGLMTPWERK